MDSGAISDANDLSQEDVNNENEDFALATEMKCFLDKMSDLGIEASNDKNDLGEIPLSLRLIARPGVNPYSADFAETSDTYARLQASIKVFAQLLNNRKGLEERRRRLNRKALREVLQLYVSRTALPQAMY